MNIQFASNAGLSQRFLLSCLAAWSCSAAPPDAPGQVRVTPGNTSNSIAWEAVPNATSYHVKYTDRRSGQGSVVAQDIRETSWTHEGVRNRRRAYYTITANNEDGESADSVRLQVTPGEPLLHWLSPGAAVEKLADGMQFTEGPVWNPDGDGFVIFSDINANRLYQWEFEQGLEVFRAPSERANGNTFDNDGRLITCEHLTRRITRTEADGSIVPLVETQDGKRFNSPNDVVVKSDGTLWFTDPTWGLSGRKEQDGQYVYRFDPSTNTTTRVAEGFQQPNGLCFSPDESILYVAESAGPLNVRAFDVQPDGTLSNDRIFADPTGTPDGMRVDDNGWLYVAADDVIIYAPDGTQLARIDVPEVPANLCFGGEDDEMLFITARNSLYGITRRPDLVLTSIHSIPAVPSHGDFVTLQAVITNQGTGATQADQTIAVTFLAGSSPTFILSASYTGELLPGASALVTVNSGSIRGLWRAPRGSQPIQATVNLSGSFAETSSDNNTRTLNLNVAQSQTLRVTRDPISGDIQLRIPGLVGERYNIQTSTDLREWIDWQEFHIQNESTGIPLPEADQTPHRFFRTVEIPKP